MKKATMPNIYSSSVEELAKKYLDKNKQNNITVNNSSITNVKKYSKNISKINDEIKELFPDIELIIEIMTSLILAPNTMQMPVLTYKLTELKIPADIKGNILDVIKEHFDVEYGITDKLDEIVSESLYTRGAYVELNIPPSNINTIITSIKKKPGIGVENIIDSQVLSLKISEYKNEDEDFVEIKDNIVLLAQDILNDINIKTVMERSINTIMPGVEDVTLIDENFAIMNEIYDDDLYDKPIVKKVAAENVVPVASKNDPSKHYGYFIFLDESGNTISTDSIDGSNSNVLLKKFRENLKGVRKDVPEIKNIAELREIILKDKLQKYLKKSIYKNLVNVNVEIDDDLVLAIANQVLNKSKIKILFVPNELVSYYAINFRANGTGESLLERVSVLASLRGILMFTNLLSYIKSSVTTTDVRVDLDPDDPNYQATMEMIKKHVMDNRQFNFPLGILRTDDFLDWVHKLGFSFNFKHPGLPDVNIEIEEKESHITPVETDLKEMVDKNLITGLYLVPEIVDNSYSPDFATTVLANNVILTKRVLKLQRKYEKNITSDIRKKMKLDNRLKNKIREILLNNIGKVKSYIRKHDPDINKDRFNSVSDEIIINYVINRIINTITVSLPKPEVTEDTNQKDQFENFTDLLESIMDKIFSTEALPAELVGQLGDNFDNFVSVIKTIMIKNFITENNILPEFNKIFTLDEDGKPNISVMEEFNSYVKVIEKLVIPFIKDNKKLVEKIDKKIENLDNEDNETSDDSLGSDTTNTDTNTDSDNNDLTNDATDDTTDDTGDDSTGISDSKTGDNTDINESDENNDDTNNGDTDNTNEPEFGI